MIYDISPPITTDLQVWPGDTPPRRTLRADMRGGAPATTSTLCTTVHLGAHVDAPSHALVDGKSVAEYDLERFWGSCQVVRMDLTSARLPVLQAPRVLFATGSYPDCNTFSRDFAGLPLELVEELRAAGVRLVGVDTPSVDVFAAADLPVHRRLLESDIAILEGLVLAGVPAGVYELAAFPLRLVGFEASPVRAVLRACDIG